MDSLNPGIVMYRLFILSPFLVTLACVALLCFSSPTGVGAILVWLFLIIGGALSIVNIFGFQLVVMGKMTGGRTHLQAWGDLFLELFVFSSVK